MARDIHMRVEVRRTLTESKLISEAVDAIQEIQDASSELTEWACSPWRTASDQDYIRDRTDELRALRASVVRWLRAIRDITPVTRWQLVGEEFVDVHATLRDLSSFAPREWLGLDLRSQPPFKTAVPYSCHEGPIYALLADASKDPDIGIEPISQPRGMPDDVSLGGMVFTHLEGDHHRSYVTLAELDRVDWNERLRGVDSPPDDMDSRIDGVGGFYRHTLPQLYALARRCAVGLEDVRIVFSFSN